MDKGDFAYTSAMIGLIFFGLLIIMLFLYPDWHNLPFVKKDFDKSFNQVRIYKGQPIIEDYFIPRWKSRESWQAWYDPNYKSAGQVHSGKIYYVIDGEIDNETDFYSKHIDAFRRVRLSRSYFYKTDSVFFKLDTLRSDNEIISSKTLDNNTGDSIYQLWTRKSK